MNKEMMDLEARAQRAAKSGDKEEAAKVAAGKPPLLKQSSNRLMTFETLIWHE